MKAPLMENMQPFSYFRPMHWVLGGCACVSGLAFLIAAGWGSNNRDANLAMVATKAIPSGLMGVIAATVPCADHFNYFLAVAFAFACGGDFLLSLPGSFFVPGMGLFALHHIVMIITFSIGRPRLHLLRLIPGALVGAAMTATVWEEMGSVVMHVAMVVYMVLSVIVCWRCASRIGHYESSLSTKRYEFQQNEKIVLFQVLPLVGVSIFAVSDYLIAVNRFLSPLGASAEYCIMLTYWGGQVLILVAVCRHAWRPKTKSSVVLGLIHT
eukprot:CAMPEP_0114553530 /NCGR_PEP_ID=MMETSP0114-20121206/7712_1 /TAXON_ID=31324 /ORGANISM="Goniomonas sp, Strain m" /LENGTH=267 /DNA_ID=CAMNT_0001738489 /DNA_START=44 /DNA_END=847 /DNA_ORIENTATION=-